MRRLAIINQITVNVNAGGQKYNYEYVMPQQPVQAAAGQPVEEDVIN